MKNTNTIEAASSTSTIEAASSTSTIEAAPAVNVTSHIEPKVLEIKRSLLDTVLALEKANVSREAIRQITADQLKEIDAERKGMRDSLIAHFTGFTAVDGVSIANALSAPITGADDAERKRLSRRRGLFVSCLSSSHNEYDFSVEKGRHSKGIIATYIGDEHERKAKELFAAMSEVRKYFPELTDISRIDIADALRGGKAFEPVIVCIDGSKVVARSTEEYGTAHLDRLAAIADSIKGQQERAQQAQG